jgi:hypothetical protein
MDKKVIYISGRRFGKSTIFKYETELRLLIKQEQEMKNPLLKEWFELRNKIRALDRKIKDMKNGKID